MSSGSSNSRKNRARGWERSRAGRNNGWPWRAHSWATRICSSSTSRPPVSTRRPGDSSGISSRNSSSPDEPFCSPHTIWTKRNGCAIAWRSWTMVASSRSAVLGSSSLRPEQSMSWSSHPRASAGSTSRGSIRIEGVRNVRTEDHGVLVHVSELHSAVPALLQELARQGVALTELRTHSASLEDVFVGLTGRHLREE